MGQVVQFLKSGGVILNCPRCSAKMSSQLVPEVKRAGWLSIFVFIALVTIFSFISLFIAVIVGLLALLPLLRERRLKTVSYMVCPDCGYKFVANRINMFRYRERKNNEGVGTPIRNVDFDDICDDMFFLISNTQKPRPVENWTCGKCGKENSGTITRCRCGCTVKDSNYLKAQKSLFEQSTRSKKLSEEDIEYKSECLDVDTVDSLDAAYRASPIVTLTESEFFRKILNPIVTSYDCRIDRKVGVKDLVTALKSNPKFISNFNKISQKHIDFSIFENNAPKKCIDKPVFLIEYDDSSHNLDKAKKNDEFKNELFEAIGVPLERISVCSSNKELKSEVERLCRKYLRKINVCIAYDKKDEAKKLSQYVRYNNDVRWYVIGEVTAEKLLSNGLGIIFLNVKDGEKDEAEALGAKCNPKGEWYIDTDKNFDKLKEWIY